MGDGPLVDVDVAVAVDVDVDVGVGVEEDVGVGEGVAVGRAFERYSNAPMSQIGSVSPLPSIGRM